MKLWLRIILSVEKLKEMNHFSCHQNGYFNKNSYFIKFELKITHHHFGGQSAVSKQRKILNAAFSRSWLDEGSLGWYLQNVKLYINHITITSLLSGYKDYINLIDSLSDEIV